MAHANSLTLLGFMAACRRPTTEVAGVSGRHTLQHSFLYLALRRMSIEPELEALRSGHVTGPVALFPHMQEKKTRPNIYPNTTMERYAG